MFDVQEEYLGESTVNVSSFCSSRNALIMFDVALNMNDIYKSFFYIFMKTLTNFQGSYLEGISKGIGGLTQKVKSWYWGRPLVSLECLLCVQTCKNPFILRTMISNTSF